MPYGGRYRRLSSKNRRLNRYNFVKNSKHGAILIEFAFAVPVLFSLIYYVQDLATIKRWHSKLGFSLYCVANMFQNTPNITKKDFSRICYAGVMGMSEDSANSIKPASYTVYIIISALCITGTENNRCKINWFAWSNVSATQNHVGITTSGYPGSWGSIFRLKSIKVGSEYAITQLPCSININTGETKIILEISIYDAASKRDYQDYFKLFFAKISPAFSIEDCNTIMHHMITFTPKPGTFNPNEFPQ